MQDDFEYKRAYRRRSSAPGLDRDAIAQEESVSATLTAKHVSAGLKTVEIGRF